MKFQFGKYTEITDLYKKYRKSILQSGVYIRFFICLDVNDIWIIRILDGINENYEEEDGVLLMERNKIPKHSKSDELDLSKCIDIIKEDDLSNWDIMEYYDI